MILPLKGDINGLGELVNQKIEQVATVLSQVGIAETQAPLIIGLAEIENKKYYVT